MSIIQLASRMSLQPKEKEKLIFLTQVRLAWEADISISSSSVEIHRDYQILIKEIIILKDICLHCSLHQPVESRPCGWQEPVSPA